MVCSGNENFKDEAKRMDTYEDEIDLMDSIRVIIKQKMLILSIFIAVISAAIIMGMFLPKIYKAEALIMIMPSKIQSQLSPMRISLNTEKTEQGEYVSAQQPTISILTHRTLIKSNAVLQKVMDKLKSTGKVDENLTIEGLSTMLEIEEVKVSDEQVNILQLAAKSKTPCLAKDIVNIWADEYTQYSLGIITGEVQNSGNFVIKQFGLAEGELVKAEQAVKDFDVKEPLLLMEIELKENISQLDAHYANVQKLDFSLEEKKNILKKTDADITAMTKDGMWTGAFSVKEAGEKYFADETLTNEQKILRQKALKAKFDLENSREKRDSFVNDSKIMLLGAEVERKRVDIVNDKTRLSQIRQLSASTKANLHLKANLAALKELRCPIAENLSELTIWEILSLTEGYNFFETNSQSLASKLEQQEEELKEMEKVLFGNKNALKTLDENLDRAQVNYDFYYGQLKSLQNQKISIEMEITKLEFELLYSRQMVEKLEGQVKTLKTAINEKKTKLMGLNRQLDIAKNAYTTLASKLEDARIAKALELGEIKVVSTAFEPQKPVASKRKFIVAIAGVIGLMLGIFVAFYAEFWQKNKDTKKSQVQTS